MKVLGLLLTLTRNSQMNSLERTLGELPGLSVGDCDGSYLAAVLEGDTTAEIDRQLDAIEQTPGVALVQVVSVYWDEPDGDEAHRLRGKHRLIRKEHLREERLRDKHLREEHSRDKQITRTDMTGGSVNASLNGESR